MNTTYRTDIDGLRAVAVIPVVLFHAGLDSFSGGFVGVDIFFVISGFLITRLILQDIKNHSFTVLSFYERRIRRIFPALACVLLTSTILAFSLLLPSEFIAYAKTLVSSSLFYANYHFMFDAGYFTAPAETNPLLHTWSLSVEEQFYIFFPPALYLLSKHCRKTLGHVIAGTAAVSFFYAIWLVDANAEHAFFSTPARAWELLIGALIAIYEKKGLKNRLAAESIAILGLCAITASIFLFHPALLFPGATAILPAGGTALLIYAGAKHNTTIGNALSTKPMQLIGKISYPLYLWHWPALVFHRVYSIRPPTPFETGITLCITIALSYLTYKIIETPIRARRAFPTQRKTLIAGTLAISFGSMIGAGLIITDGIPSRFPQEIQEIAKTSQDLQAKRPTIKLETTTGLQIKATPIGENGASNPTFLVWGDSHGESLLPGIISSATRLGRSGLFVGKGGCLPLSEAHQIRKGYEDCPHIARATIEYLAENSNIQTVILISRWSIYAMGERFKNEPGHKVFIRDSETKEPSLEENKAVFSRSLERTLSILEQQGKKIVLVNQTPETEWHIPTALARAEWLKRDLDFNPSLKDYQARNLFVTTLFDESTKTFGLTIIHPEKWMCSDTKCKVEKDGKPIYRDTNHITRAQAESMAEMFDSIL